jgi:hypothetical protein
MAAAAAAVETEAEAGGARWPAAATAGGMKRRLEHNDDRMSTRPRTRRTPTGEEAYRSVERNAREFAYYEGWDWEAAIEEEDTFLDDDTGERVHPMHYCDVAAANQQRTTGRRQRGERERGDDGEHTDAYGAKKKHSM